MLRLINSIPLLYLAMLWPGRWAIWGLVDQTLYYPWMMYDSGIWSIRLLILTLAVTPVLMLINRLGRGKAFGRWLLPRRRHLGLGSFVHSTVHLLHYTIETASLRFMWVEATALELAVGWGAFVVFLALAVTSNNRATRAMGRQWKRLHVWVYPAAGLTFLHWYLFDFFTERVLFWLGILIGVKLVHLALIALPRRRVQTRHQPSA